MGLRSFQSRIIVSSGNSKVVSLLQNRVTFGPFQRCETLLHTFNLHSKELSETRARPMLSLSTTARITYAAAISELFGVSEEGSSRHLDWQNVVQGDVASGQVAALPDQEDGAALRTQRRATKKAEKLAHDHLQDTEDGAEDISSAWCLHDTSIDELLHEKTQCGFVTTFEDPSGPDWAGVLRSFQQSMRQLYRASRVLAHASHPKCTANVCLASYAEAFLSLLT